MRILTALVTASCFLASPSHATEKTTTSEQTKTFATPGTPGALSSSGYKNSTQLLPLPESFSVDEKGDLKIDGKAWKAEKEEDGTELFTLKNEKKESKDSVRAAALKTKEGKLESLTAFKLLTSKTTAKTQEEDASTIFFESEKLAAVTSCEDREATGAPGRVCVTATPKLCSALQNGTGVTAEILKEMDSFEMRALAIVLTLRGPDHQLDNVVKTGNRLGLKSALQTTKGQLIAIARQVQKELAAKSKKEDRSVASAPGAVTSENAKSASQALDPQVTRKVLERSLPRLKQSCTDSGFAIAQVTPQ